MKSTMIKVILVRLDGNETPDGLRLAAARDLAQLFDAQIVGLLLNALPVPVAGTAVSVDVWSPLAAAARKTGDVASVTLKRRMAALGRPAELRRFDVFESDIGSVCARAQRDRAHRRQGEAARNRRPDR